MSKCLKLVAILLCVSGATSAQVPVDTLQSDNFDFTFSESQLDDDNDALQAVSTITSTNNDPYLGEVGYRLSPMRFRIRAYDNMYEQTYLNGLLMNDVETGRFQHSMIGGMNDATRNNEGVAGFEYNTFGLTTIGGASNINMRASAFAAGNKITLTGTNRNYVLRGMYTFATGLMDNGWAFAGTVGYRWAKEGVIEGTFYNSLSYLLSVEKLLGNHSLSLVTFGSPTERAQQGASTEEAYWLANSHYYNPYWGYQNGKKRNQRVTHEFEPTAILTWDWKIDDSKKLATSAGVKYSRFSTSSLGWNGNAYDPRPDYYKNLPSSIFDVYDLENKNNPDFLHDNPYFLSQYNDLYNFWTSSEANRQINWDRMYYVNSIQNQSGDETLYYLERRHNDQLVFTFNSTFNHNIDINNKYSLGIILNHTKGMHYKTMDDLLGGEYYYDYDKFSANEYGKSSSEAANDLRNPFKRIYEGDKFGYNYNINVNKAKAWGVIQHTNGMFDIMHGLYIEGTTIERDGKMQNGRAPQNSYGSSGTAKFLGGGGKLLMTLRPFVGNTISLGLGWDTQAPLARNAFVAPRMQSNFIDNLHNEDIFSSELSWKFHFGSLTGKFTGFFTRFKNQVEQTAFYNDQENRFTYLTMTGVSKEHYGLEGALVFRVNSKLSFDLVGTISDAKYIDNPYAQVNYEGMNSATNESLNEWLNPITDANMPLRVIMKDIKVGGTPLTAASFGVNYNINNWFLEMNVNYYDRVYLEYSAYRRLSNVLTNYTAIGSLNGTPVFNIDDGTGRSSQQILAEDGGVLFDTNGNYLGAYSPSLEKFKGGFMLDAAIGKNIRLNGGRSISINLSLQNITNNTNLRSGGFEQNRDDYYRKEGAADVAKAYKFSKNSKYFYANAFNAFLSINYKF
ncbi:MAG: TonB-dependent receptor [Bacteroidaceae bacterium]|nr:TonB-dependent receptor [Bacteroidaceae bacterium]